MIVIVGRNDLANFQEPFYFDWNNLMSENDKQ